jgi:serine/threonine protein kinase/Leucine-rich repeat (LRR) protein
MNEAGPPDEAVFEVALTLSGSERAAYLERACAGDMPLRGRVEALLGAFERAGGFMNRPVIPALGQTVRVPLPLTEKPGDRIGRYKLLEQIGEGGCGVVYVAEQEEPVRRRVALKVIKLGMDTKEVIARFDAERQALAMMEHPNIAKIHDAGATDTGRPFFVMELVRGIKITDFCEQHRRAPRERLDLFVQVCRAIQHAHQKGVIHRDIKPSNVLVASDDGVPVPKVIDFGIAKAAQGRLTDQTVYTAFAQFIGTPAYMSPEQAQLTMQDIDTRSDIYSLGVLLYELLTGTTPFDAKELLSKGIDEMRRTIREVEPVKPSTRVTQDYLTSHGDSSTKSAILNPQSAIPSDLDWIVMKCLEKDRSRRYETANGLATDIARHLANEPIFARPPSRWYWFQKVVRRHRVGFAASVAIIIAVGAGFAFTLWQSKRSVAALNELRATAPAFAAEARSLAARQQFDEAIGKLEYALKLRPEEPEYWVKKGDLLQSQLKLADAAVAYRKALRLKPGLARAEASAKLCDELMAASPGPGGKPTRQSLARLYVAMQQQQRPAAELMLVAQLLGEEKKLLLEYWLDRLDQLPVSAERPLKERLTARDDGWLALDLSGTRIANIVPLAEMPLAALNLGNCRHVIDFTPLQNFRSLVELNLESTKITDLAPLRGLPLTDLRLSETEIFDLQPLRGMKLKTLVLRNTRVADLSALKSMPLAYFSTAGIPAMDYSPLAGAPLKECYIQNSPLRDLSFLRHSPVEQLSLFGCASARGFGVLAELKSLNLLVLPSNYRTLPTQDRAAVAALRTHPTLKNIDAFQRGEGNWSFRTAQTADEFWKFWDYETALAESLGSAGFVYNLSMLANGKYRLSIRNQKLSDLSFLKDKPIGELVLYGTSVTDLRPLEHLALTHLDIRLTPVKDLSPLRAPVLSGSLRQLELWRIPATDFSPLAACTNLEWFDAAETALANLEVLRGDRLRTALLSNSKVTNISALAGMPLERLTLSDTPVTDVQPLLQCPTLSELVLPRGASNVNALRSLTRIKRLSYNELEGLARQSAEEFWFGQEHGDITLATASKWKEWSVRAPGDETLGMKVAAIQYWFGLDAEYAATCKRMIEIAERENKSSASERAAKNWCLQTRGDVAMVPRILALARKGAEMEGDPGRRPWCKQTLGMAEFRAGNAEAAEAAFLKAETAAQVDHWPTRSRPFILAPCGFFRAMLLFRKGNIEEAKKLFDEAEAVMPPIPENAARALPVEVSQNQLLCWLIWKEARAELKLGASTRP